MNVQYITPTCTDTAVCLCFFSPNGFIKPKMNLLFIENKLKKSNIPVFTAECVIGTQEPVLFEPTLQVKSDSYLFYKEQLYNLLIPKIPAQYTKLVFIDSDIVFNQTNWIDEISGLLDTHDIVQPFKTAFWMGPDNRKFIKKNTSIAYFLKNHELFENKDAYANHCGFAWAMRRDYFEKIGGFFDKAVLGGGDTFFANICNNNNVTFNITRYIESEYEKWLSTALKVERSFTYMPCVVFHMFHGSTKNRQYSTRYNILESTNDKQFDDLFYKNTDGLYELYDKQLNLLLRQYFISREEDSVLE